MSRKSLTLAIAAALSIGALALASSEASARSFGGGGGMHASGGFHTAPRSVGVMRPGLVTGLRIPGKVTGIKIPGHPGKITGIWIKPHHHHHWHWRYGWWRRGLWVAPVIATGGVATYAATAPSTNRCTCLTKDYTPQGAVVFKDVCTNEMAMNPPFNASPAADVAPQMPQQPMQQGYLQPQAQ
jgi:hypothetical protein